MPLAFAAVTVIALVIAGLVARPVSGTLVLAAVILGTGTAVLYPTLAALVVDRAEAMERGLALGTLSASWALVGTFALAFIESRGTRRGVAVIGGAS